ncbi:hypothetical protein [Micromonospora sp. RTP1Z1]|nr:hypothetical protein [Micromonospora sp. RTP1Z1]
MFTLFRRRRNAAARSYRGRSYRRITPPPAAQAWRANGGRW